MKVYRAATTIEASPETIWTILTDAARYPEWDSSVDRIEGRIAPGEKITAYTKLSPGRAFPATVIAFVPGRETSSSSGLPMGLFKTERTFPLETQGTGAPQFPVQEALSGLLLGLFGRSIPDMTATFEQFAAGLKRRAEG